MGRHTKRERTEDEPAPGDPAPAGSFYGAHPGPSFEAFSGPTDDQVFFSDPFPSAALPGSPAGPPPAAQRQHGPPERYEPDAYEPERYEPERYGAERYEPWSGEGMAAPVAAPMPGHPAQQGVLDYPGASAAGAPPVPPAAPAYGPGADYKTGTDYETGPGHETGAGHETGPGDDPAAPDSAASTRARVAKLVSALPVPMLPIVALVIAVGIVAYALSTQQISLNFAGGAPKSPIKNPRDSTVSQRGPGNRASRASRPDGLVIAFHVTSRTRTAFRATATVANQGQQPVQHWAVAFRIQNVTFHAVSGATLVKTGKQLYVRGRTPLAPGRSVRFVFTATGTPHKPDYCLMNSLPCTVL